MCFIADVYTFLDLICQLDFVRRLSPDGDTTYYVEQTVLDDFHREYIDCIHINGVQ